MNKKYEHLLKSGRDRASAMERLYEIVSILRVECPWDKVQTHDTLRKCMIEEAYEAVDAIDKEDFTNLREELGDVLLQVVFHSNLAEEEEHFDFVSVINEECEKMIRRHPHVFGESGIDTVDGVLEKWEKIKQKEHIQESYTKRLIDVPEALPALIRSSKVQKKAADCGFDWDNIDDPIKKIEEELAEFVDAYKNESKERAVEEFGDLLFAAVNVSRFAEIDAEDALRKATEKFITRFKAMEDIASEKELDMNNMNMIELDELWNKAKEVR